MGYCILGLLIRLLGSLLEPEFSQIFKGNSRRETESSNSDIILNKAFQEGW